MAGDDPATPEAEFKVEFNAEPPTPSALPAVFVAAPTVAPVAEVASPINPRPRAALDEPTPAPESGMASISLPPGGNN